MKGKFEITVVGYNPYRIKVNELGFFIIEGKEITRKYVISATTQEKAEEVAIKKFEKEGGYFDEIQSVKRIS